MDNRAKSRTVLSAIIALTVVCTVVSVDHASDLAIPAGDHRLSLEVGGRTRSYLIHVPSTVDPDQAVPLVFLFHAGFGTGRSMQEMSRMDPIADREGFVTVYPDGVGRAWNAGDCCGRPERRRINDVQFVRALVDEIGSELSIDSRRIYAAGMSNGAMFVHRLGCELSDKIAALGTVAGTIRVESCPAERPVPIIHFHGTADRLVPWEGGFGLISLSGFHTSVPDTIFGWQQRNGCSEQSVLVGIHGQVTCDSYAPCTDDGEVILCSVLGGGHQWPDRELVWESKLGPMTLSASEEIWRFFRAHPMPEHQTKPSQGPGSS